MTGDNDTLTRGELFEVLSHQRRRRLLKAIATESSRGPASVVQKHNGDLMMSHCHLPKLSEYGLINWERNTGSISKGPNFEEARPLLEFLVENENELPPPEPI